MMIQIPGSKQLQDTPSENPPAYSDYNSSSGSSRTSQSSSRNNASNLDAPERSLEPVMIYDQVQIFDSKSEIKGTFYVNPQFVPTLCPDGHRRQKDCAGKRWKGSEPTHASFFTRHRPIALNLGTAGDVTEAPKANVSVCNRSSDITLNLLPIKAFQPRIGLEAFSKKGNVVVYLPDDFCGIVHMESRNGTLEILPALKSRIKVAKRTERDILFMVDDQTRRDGCQEVSFCHLKTRKGNVVVGTSGVDDYVPKMGFWKKLFGN